MSKRWRVERLFFRHSSLITHLSSLITHLSSLITFNSSLVTCARITLEWVARLGYSLASLPLLCFVRHLGDHYDKPHSACIKGGTLQPLAHLRLRMDFIAGHRRGGPTTCPAQARAAYDIG
jgi:hypothetical protein